MAGVPCFELLWIFRFEKNPANSRNALHRAICCEPDDTPAKESTDFEALLSSFMAENQMPALQPNIQDAQRRRERE